MKTKIVVMNEKIFKGDLIAEAGKVYDYLDCCECAGVVLAAIRLLENLDENGRGHGNPEADALRAAIAKAEEKSK